jgi:hypothetical protein
MNSSQSFFLTIFFCFNSELYFTNPFLCSIFQNFVLFESKCEGVYIARFCIRWSLSCELTASQLVVTATRSDTDSQDRLDLIQSIVPTHYTCNGYVSWFCYLEVHILFWVEEVETLYIHLRIYSQTTQSFGKVTTRCDAVSSQDRLHLIQNRVVMRLVHTTGSIWYKTELWCG